MDSVKRKEVMRAVLDHLRMLLAIDAETLTVERTRSLAARGHELKDPWRLEDREYLRLQTHAVLPGTKLNDGDKRAGARSLGSRSAVARHLRSSRTWRTKTDLTSQQVETLIDIIVKELRGNVVSVVTNKQQQEYAVRIKASGLLWTAGDDAIPALDPVRGKAIHLRGEVEGPRTRTSPDSTSRGRAR